MSKAMLRGAALATVLAAAAPAMLGAQAAARRPITFADFAAVRGVGDPQVSPDGGTVLYAVRVADVAANRRTTTTWLAPLDGGAARQFPASDVAAAEARWSPDGRWAAYTAGGQLWISDARTAERRQLTRLNGGASGPVWSPAGNAIVFTSTVWPACTTGPNGNDDACNVRRDSVQAASKVKAHVADRLMYRHWTAWDEGTRQHLFVVTLDGPGAASTPRDLTPGAAYDVPPGPFGGSEGYAVSPDGREVAYTAKEQTRDEAWSTDLNLYTVPLGGGAATVVTAGMKGADENPVYSPDGRWLAFQSQRRAGFESDRWRLMLLDRSTRKIHEVLPAWDRNADAYLFAPDARALYVQSVDASRTKLYHVTLDAAGVAAGAPALVVGDHNNASPSLSKDARTVAWVRDATEQPAEVWTASLDGARAANVRQLTHLNDDLVSRLAVNAAEDFWFTGAAGARVQGLVVRPPNWEAGKKYPTLLVIHGGPQGEWLDNWHSRWNYQMLAAPGFGLVIINPRGSIGYGQQFVDDVSKDWGGKAYVDLMKGLDAAIAKNAWIDTTRLGATGGSYGGYMTNWLATHETKRFKAFVTHAGIWNIENMYGATEEIWFPEWEYGGPYWNATAMATQYRKWSPHLFAANLKRPHLVMTGELDFRVPYYENLSLFTALQKQNVPSRLVVFPDEGHWIGKPQNQQLWWQEMQGWFAKYLLGGTGTAHVGGA